MEEVLEVVADDYFPTVPDQVATTFSTGGLSETAWSVLGGAWRIASGLLIPSDDERSGAGLNQDIVAAAKNLVGAAGDMWPASGAIGPWEMSRTAMMALFVALSLTGLLLLIHFRYRVYMAELHWLEREYPWRGGDDD